ncbi:hypothetical protein L208DRAFT_1378567 [Tricholoma matsutake]|nr:hypothetical protein L208DRAFT_1378567 [Tricholoma matsutake 945]
MAQDVTFSRSAKNVSPTKLQFLITGQLFSMQPSAAEKRASNKRKCQSPPPPGRTIVKTKKAKVQGGQSAASKSEKKTKGKAPTTDPKIVIEDIESSLALRASAENLPLDEETPTKMAAGSDEENSDNDPAEDSDTDVMKSPCPDPHLAPIYQNLPALP